ncbi:MAG: hypothetical protein KDC98_26250, partial [Planctomycetes bacterium]|nr:hypothetical protein [Planctomycetota bacterium]
MAREKRLELVITGDARKAQKALNDLDAAAGKSQKATGKALDGIKGKMLDLGVAAGLYSATQSASDLGEALNVTGLIFRDARGEIDEFVKSSTELGFSETQARELTASIGGLLDNVGLAQDETVKWSKDLLELGADMGSAFNEDPADAVSAIGAAVRGETEPIRRYNVMLDDASVRAKAVEMGLAATTSEVDKAGKAQATLALIMEQTDAVQGDFRNTSDGLANQQRIMAAEFENAKAKLGAGLLPVMTGAVGVAADLAGGFADLDGWQQKLILGTGAGAYAWLRWGDQIGNVASLMKRGVGDGRAYVSMISEATKNRAAGVSRSRAALDAMNDSMEDGGKRAKRLGTALGAIGFAASAYEIAAWGQSMTDAIDSSDKLLGATNDDLAKLAAMWAEFGSDRFVRAGQENIETLYAMRDAVKAAGGETKMLDDAIAEVTAENVRAAERTDTYAGALGDLGGEAAGTADDLDDAAEKAKKVERWLGDL